MKVGDKLLEFSIRNDIYPYYHILIKDDIAGWYSWAIFLHLDFAIEYTKNVHSPCVVIDSRDFDVGYPVRFAKGW